ncbi:Gfo/Idh/MocA family oxidoreductase [Kribbella qitaiheensis]|uniref:Gfo/Idh/MocA family oxidoreductase n=1 Tax=Kribbella qitaiheensis TaxID=1544730 RepID=A0A7G6WUG1_9ACTN|nr:Gfo/Idh/MocA family oxidoreductase [Kribbella qitaiheensis]QNE17626.1 Gfo/Idh/MocA family oxidoreductase [Kribbella qitaiheensis]
MSTGARKLRVGIVGGGFMGRVHGRSALVSGAQVVGAVGSGPDRAGAAAEATGADQGFATLDELLASDVDLIHVCTPNNTHLPVALRALDAGKHVICEKPLATSAKDATGLLAAAEEAGRIGTVPFVYRYHPMVRELRTRIAAGDAGQITSLHGSYLQDWLAEADDDNWRVDDQAGGPSRAFADIGSHWCDLTEFVTGDRIAEISAQTRTIRGTRGGVEVRTEDLATAQFRTAAGVVGTVVVSQVAAGRKNRLYLEVSGTESSFGFDQEDPDRLWVGRRVASELLTRDPDTLSPPAARVNRLPAGHAQGYQDAFDSFVADSYAAAQGDRPDGLPDFAAGARSTRIVDAVLRSAAADGAWTTVDSL